MKHRPIFFGIMAALATMLLWACSGKSDTEPVGPENSELRLTLKTKYTYGSPSWNLSKTVRYYSMPGNGTVLTCGQDGLYGNSAVKETEGSSHLVVSPDVQASYNGLSIAVDFPEEHVAREGIIPDEYAFALGKSSSKTITMQPLFCSLVLNFVRDDVKSATFKTADGEYIAGRVRFSADNLATEDVTYRSQVRIQAAGGFLEPGKDWIIVLPPVSLKKGFTIAVETSANTYEFTYSKALKLAPGDFLRLEVTDDQSRPKTPGTGLRTLIISTPDGRSIDSKTVWTENCSMMLVDDHGKIYYENSNVSVKGRGNSTWWNYPKKPYAIKLPEKADLIGTGADKRWVLLANWMDRTLLRNEIAFEIARRTKLEWTPSGEFVELYLNGTHLGNYWLGEKIKTGKSRLTADFLIEMDTYYDATWRFYSQYGRRYNDNKTGMPIGVKEPDDDEMTSELFQTLKDLVGNAEKALYTGASDWKDKMDMTTFIDWYLVHEITYNKEPNHPKSCYFYFRNGVMYAGPVWDFDWYTFQENKSSLAISKSIYFEQLLKDAGFKAALKSRWTELKPLLSSIPDYIDAKAGEIRKSEAINWSMWPCTSSGVNGDEGLSFDNAIARMKSAFTSRVNALDKAVSAL